MRLAFSIFGRVRLVTGTPIGVTSTNFSANTFGMTFGGCVDAYVSRQIVMPAVQADYVPKHW
jgi:hypothetical protein